MDELISTFLVYLRLGLTSFGGPVAHLGYFREEFVVRRKWLSDQAFADIVALSQTLPGPASSQVGAGIGLTRHGIPGALVAWLGFTLPSAALMTLFGMGVTRFRDTLDQSWLHGLKLVAVAVVAQALWGMAKNLCPDKPRATMAVAAGAALLLVPSPLLQIAMIVAGALIGALFLKDQTRGAGGVLRVPVSRKVGCIALALFALCFFGLPLFSTPELDLFSRFFRPGALVFGGGHVVLPLLQTRVVDSGLMTNDVFLAGYSAAQAVPGPLFTVAAYLGAVAAPARPIAGAALATIGIFLPGLLLMIGALPFWEGLSARTRFRRAVTGVNASVVGILLAAFFTPVWTSAVAAPADFAVVAAALLALTIWRAPAWSVVLGVSFLAHIIL